eukprot:2257501-Rhodomonas_salina.4
MVPHWQTQADSLRGPGENAHYRPEQQYHSCTVTTELRHRTHCCGLDSVTRRTARMPVTGVTATDCHGPGRSLADSAGPRLTASQPERQPEGATVTVAALARLSLRSATT